MPWIISWLGSGFTLQVRICAFPASRLGLTGIGISPDCNPADRASPRQVQRRKSTLEIHLILGLMFSSYWSSFADHFQLFNWALEPADDHVLDELFELGYLDAGVWAEQNPIESIASEGSSWWTLDSCRGLSNSSCYEWAPVLFAALIGNPPWWERRWTASGEHMIWWWARRSDIEMICREGSKVFVLFGFIYLALMDWLPVLPFFRFGCLERKKEGVDFGEHAQLGSMRPSYEENHC